MILGFRCPEGKGNVSFRECLRCAASQKQPCQYDYPILSAMQVNLNHNKGISVSSLLNCLRKVVLEAREDIYLDPSQLYFAFRGQLFHSVIAQAQKQDAVVEQRFERFLAGITLTGHPDVVYPRHRKLVDYKSTRRVPREDEPYASHALQVNLYRYLVEPVYRIDDLEIVYFDMSEVKRVKVKPMDNRVLVAWLIPRIEKLKTGLQGGPLPERADSEGVWQCNGYCPFSELCWPEGVPTASELKRIEQEQEERIEV